MRKLKFVSVFMLLALLLNAASGTVLADEPMPDGPPSGEEPREIEAVEKVQKESGGPGLRGVVPGPGGEYAILYSILQYYFDGDGDEHVRGKVKVELTEPGQSALCWSDLYKNHGQVDSCSGWSGSATPSLCLCSEPMSYHEGNGDYWENKAKTYIHWSGGGGSSATATVDKQF